MTMSEATPRRVRLAEAREARIHRPEAAAAYEQARLRYELAEAIRARREELGWSQRQLAERAGMTQPGVHRAPVCLIHQGRADTVADRRVEAGALLAGREVSYPNCDVGHICLALAVAGGR